MQDPALKNRENQTALDIATRCGRTELAGTHMHLALGLGHNTLSLIDCHAAVIAAAAARRSASTIGYAGGFPRTGSSSGLSSASSAASSSAREGGSGTQDVGRAPVRIIVARPNVLPGVVQKTAPTDAELLEAAEFGQSHRLNKLLARPGANLNCKDTVRGVGVRMGGRRLLTGGAQMGLTPLMWAARNGHIVALRALSAHGADLHVGDAVVRQFA